VLYACDPSTLLPSYFPISGNTSRVLYARDFDFPARTLPWIGLYLGSESRSANRLPDFSAASCTEPLLVLSTWPHHTQAIPSRVLYACDFVFSGLGLDLGSESRSANRLPDFSAASCTEPLLLCSACPHTSKSTPRSPFITGVVATKTLASVSYRPTYLPRLYLLYSTDASLVDMSSICPPHTQAIPSRTLYARDSVLFAWTLPWIWSSANRLPNFSAAPRFEL
jgi:hypothetical protein